MNLAGIEDAEAEQILNAVVDNGIFIDAANDYGRSEEYIGRFCRAAAMSSSGRKMRLHSRAPRGEH